METKFKNITDTEQELTISYSKSEIQPILDKALSNVAKNIRLDGFRAGKAPIHLIKKMYGQSIEYDEFSKLAEKSIPEVLQKNKLFVVSQPHLHKLEKVDDGLEIVVHYHYIPDFELKDYKSLVVDEPVHRVTDSEIDEIIDNMVYSSNNFESVDEVIDKNCNVYVEILKDDVKTEENKELEDKEQSSEENKTESMPVLLRDKRLSSKFTDLFLNKKVDEIFEYSIKDLYDDIEIPTDQDNKVTKLKITKIDKIIPQEINEEFILKYSNNKFTNLEDLKEDIGFEIQNNWDKKSRSIVEDNIVNKLISLHEIKIPDFTILEQAKKMFDEDKKNNRNGNESFDDELVKKFYIETAQKVIKWELIRDKIIEIEKIEVEDHDIDEFIEKYKFYESLDRDLVKQTILENKQIINTIMVQKVMNFLIDFSTTNEVEFSEKDKAMSIYNDDDFEQEEMFDADEEFIDETEFDDEFFEDEDFDDEDLDEEYDDDEEYEEEDDEEYDDDDEEEYDEDDDEASSK